MPPVEIKIKLQEPVIAEGGHLLLEHTITNVQSGNRLIQVDEGGGRYEYEFRSKQRGVLLVSEASRRKVSKADYVDEASYVYGDAPLPNPVPPRRMAIKAGASEVFVDDISKWYVQPLTPGEYQLIVHYNGLDGLRVSSPPISIRIVKRKASYK